MSSNDANSLLNFAVELNTLSFFAKIVLSKALGFVVTFLN